MNVAVDVELDHARETASVIPPNVLVHVLVYADECGVDTRAWFSGLGLTRAQMLDPQVKVSYHQARTILLRAIAALGEPALGLIVGRRQKIGSFGLLGLLMMTSATFGEAMHQAIDNHQICGCLLDIGFEQLSGEEVALALWPRFDDPQLQPFLCEEVIASSLMIAIQLLGPEFGLKRIELTYAAPAYKSLYPRVLGTHVQFGARHNRAVIDAQWLTRPLPGHNPLTARQALELCKIQLSQRHDCRDEIVTAVQGLLRDRLDHPPRIGEVAVALNLSERSLRRKLADTGHAFREILNEVRTERALELLRGGSMPVMDVADAIGFSDAREFRRAFKRWTGISPREARHDHT
ncbi:MAG TPA: AraC family transcriptional regulator [Oleiagrimonas sp.]|nr:AraC family transcriptional regulator [Oleiagrimonas sp.]